MGVLTREEIAARVAAQFAIESQSSPSIPSSERAAKALTTVLRRLETERRVVKELVGVGVDSELAGVLLESVGGEVSDGLLEQLSESIEHRTHTLDLDHFLTEPKPAPKLDVRKDDVLLLRHRSEPAALAAPDGSLRGAVQLCIQLDAFGVWRVGDSAALLATSAAFECASALEEFFDELFNRWEPGWWDDDFEASLCSLLIGIDEDLKSWAASMSPMLRAMGQGGESSELDSMDALLERAARDVAAALNSRDAAAISRLHQTLYQFLDFGEMRMMMPPAFVAALERFDALRCARVLGALTPQIAMLAAAIPPYVSTLESQGTTGAYGGGPVVARLSALAAKLTSHIEDGSALAPSLFWGLFGGPLDPRPTLVPASSGGSASGVGASGVGARALPLQCLPVLPWHALQPGAHAELDAHVAVLNELLVRDACSIGSPLLGHQLAPAPAANASVEEERALCARTDADARLLQRLLAAGFGYVTHGDRCMPLLPMRRAVLELAPSAVRPRKLKARRKDVARMLRNAPPPHPFELRVSTDLESACTRLQLHHEHSWVGSALLRVWRHMMHAHASLVVMELWCGGEMVAADFGHPVARCFYVATRWHDSRLARYQPGFVLALASARLLAAHGYELWDLGGTDASAGMRYKESLAEILPRPYFYDRFLRARATEGPLAGQPTKPLEPGLAVGPITELDLL